jgi:hypothetical protein
VDYNPKYSYIIGMSIRNLSGNYSSSQNRQNSGSLTESINNLIDLIVAVDTQYREIKEQYEGNVRERERIKREIGGLEEEGRMLEEIWEILDGVGGEGWGKVDVWNEDIGE